jgi:hypothetical protein
MSLVAHAELIGVGPDEAVVTFTTAPGESVVTRVGAREVVTTGPFHTVVVDGLAPDTEYPLAVGGAEPDGRWLPATLRTLVRPEGQLLATIATANDVHFGETECGKTGEPAADAVGPVLRAEPGDPPYPEVMSGAIVDEMLALDPDAVVVKGDLTDTGKAQEYAAFLDCYGRLGDRMHHMRGNHDAMRDPALARNGAPFAIALEGVTLAVLDTTVPGEVGGALDVEQCAWLDDLAASTSGPVLVFSHHPAFHWDRDYCIGGDADALVAVLGRRPNIACPPVRMPTASYDAQVPGAVRRSRYAKDYRVPGDTAVRGGSPRCFAGARWRAGVVERARDVQGTTRPGARPGRGNAVSVRR